MMPSETLLELTGLRTGYGSSPILQGIDLKVRSGEIVAVIGRNGVGKSTMMRCLIGQLRVWAGAIRFDGTDISSMLPERRAQLGFGYIPQGREVFGRMTVEENLRVGEMIGVARRRRSSMRWSTSSSLSWRSGATRKPEP